jgi:MipA family protein
VDGVCRTRDAAHRSPAAKVAWPWGLRRLALAGVVAWSGVAGVAPASAADALPDARSSAAGGRTAPLWELGMGATALNLAHYRGSDQKQNWLLPLPYFVYRGEFIRADREGARAMLLKGERFQVDLSVAATAPTRSGENLARAGMPSLKPTLEVGPNLNLYLWHGADWRLLARAPVRAAFTLQSSPRHVGWSASPYLTLEGRYGEWDMGVRFGAQFGDRSLHGYVYDVQPSYATGARAAYRAQGGFGGLQATLGASRRVGSLWLGVFARADSVSGAAFDGSPLVRQRSNFSGGLALSWVFARSERMVSVAE